LLVRIHPYDLALVLVHQHLPVLRLIHFLWIVLQCEVHHDLTVEVSGIDQVINVQTLAVIERAHRVEEGETVYEDLSVYLPSRAQVVQGHTVHIAAQETSEKEGYHAR
jgi:hypothetical protein